MGETGLLILASLICGSACLIWRGKRRFNRLNQIGIEQFSSYSNKLWAIYLETLLLGGGYGLLGAAGTLHEIDWTKRVCTETILTPEIWCQFRKPMRYRLGRCLKFFCVHELLPIEVANPKKEGKRFYRQKKR